MTDGGGLCSPGRWPVHRRLLPEIGKEITAILDQGIDELLKTGSLTLPQHCLSVIVGKFPEDPWKGKTDKIKCRLKDFIASRGILFEPMQDREGQEIDFPLIHALATLCGDPDADAMRVYMTGAPLGVDEELPRTPAVWPPRSKWRLPDFDAGSQNMFCDNYPSADDFREALEMDIEEQLAVGWMVKMTLGEAKAKFREVDVAALAVVEDRPGKTRVIHDASNKVQVNHRIKVQDAELCPTALDVQAAVRGDEALRPPILAMVADVSKAHRRIPVCERDWGFMACAIEKKPEPSLLDGWNILVNTVGTYGVGSMSWHWARIGSLFQRLSYYCCGITYIFRFADDYQLLSTNLSGQGCYRPLLRWLLLARVLGVPLKWSKVRGGMTADFIGNTYDWRSLLGGLSESRSRWLVNWIDQTLSNKIVSVRELRSVIGRLGFSATLLRYLLPYLGPFYSWTAVVPDSSVRPLPVVLQFLLKWVRDRLSEKRMVQLAPVIRESSIVFMADAKAEGELVVVGGFQLPDDGNLKKARWFSYRLCPRIAPWAFCKKGQAFRVISSLELFASLLCVMLFNPDESHGAEVVVQMRGVTDNKSNEALVIKNMTTKFPAYLVLLEFTEQLRRRNLGLELTWVRRDFNQLADDLTNEQWEMFDKELRINTPIEELPWMVLKEGYPHALQLYKDLEAGRAQNRAKRLAGEFPGKSFRKKLRNTQPWGD